MADLSPGILNRSITPLTAAGLKTLVARPTPAYLTGIAILFAVCGKIGD